MYLVASITKQSFPISQIEQIIKDMILLVDIALGFCTATNTFKHF
jgi:hypothetical protein